MGDFFNPIAFGCPLRPTFPPLSRSSTQVRRGAWIPSFLSFSFGEQTLQGGLPQLPGPGHPLDPTKREITGASPSSDWLFPLVQCSPGPSLLSLRVSPRLFPGCVVFH